MRKLKSIQVLRGIAACGVVLLHAYRSSHSVDHSFMRLGASGVDLFFVISGFIIATIPKRSPGEFFFDRMWRLYPIWLVASVPWLLWIKPPAPVVASTLTHWPIYGHFVLPVLPIGWTLSFEFLFYVAAALALITRYTVPLALFGISLVAGAVLRWPVFDFIGNPMIFDFLMGVAIARLPRIEWLGWPAVAVGVVALAFSPLQIYLGETAISAATSINRVVFWGIPVAALVYGALCLESYFSRARISVLLGDASYSIYLFHIPLVQFVTTPWPVKFAIAIAGGVVMHFTVDCPIQRVRQQVKRLVALWIAEGAFFVRSRCRRSAIIDRL